MLPVLLVPALITAAPAGGAATPAAFLAKVPALPRNLANLSGADQASFQDQVRRALEWQDAQYEQVRKQQRGTEKAAAQATQAKVTGGSGQLSKEEKAKVKAMTQQEKMAWAMGKMNTVDTAALQQAAANQQQATQEYQELPQASRDRVQKVGGFDLRYEALKREFQESARAAGVAFSSPVRTITPEVSRNFLPRYQAVLTEHLAAIKAALPDYQRLAEIQGKSLGLPKESVVSLEALDAVRAYTRRTGGILDFVPVK